MGEGRKYGRESNFFGYERVNEAKKTGAAPKLVLPFVDAVGGCNVSLTKVSMIEPSASTSFLFAVLKTVSETSYR